jgi:hypothetical protein
MNNQEEQKQAYLEQKAEILRQMETKDRQIATHQNFINRYFLPAGFEYFKEWHEAEIRHLDFEKLELKQQLRNIGIDSLTNNHKPQDNE